MVIIVEGQGGRSEPMQRLGTGWLGQMSQSPSAGTVYPVPRWQQTRLVEEPAVGRIQRPAYETDAPKSVLPRFIQAAQHDGIDDVAIALQQRTGDRHAHIRRHCGIDVEQVESANLSAISTRTLIDGHQHFGIDLLVAKGERRRGWRPVRKK